MRDMGNGSSRLGRIVRLLGRDPVLWAAALAAGVSAFFVPPSAAYLSYLDLRTLGLLLALMLAVAGLQTAGAFDALVARMLRLVRSTRALAAALTGLCFFCSMAITNDVALITFVPLAVMTLTRAEQTALLIPVIVLHTVAANLGSMLTPMGTPQNLYLYSLSGMGPGQFLALMSLPTAAAAAGLGLCLLAIPRRAIAPHPERRRTPCTARGLAPWLGLFALSLLAVAHVLPWYLAPLAGVAAAAVLDRRLLRRADWGLLMTFVLFFVFIGNIKALPAVGEALSALVAGRELTAGVLLSQIISNVPAAMLLSGFSQDIPALLWGVNLGGLGTLIASMASLISYKLYAATPQARTGRYLAVFTGVNLLFLAVLWALCAGVQYLGYIL